MENSKILTIRPNEYRYISEGYNHTKVLGLKCYCGNKQKIVRRQPTTWASLAREVINSFSYEIETAVENNWEAFETEFNDALFRMIDINGLKANTSFSEKLFIEPTHIRSSVYKNNQNSMLEIFKTPMGESKYITAVYSGEVVWVLNALISALEDYDAFIEIEYINREDLQNVLEELDEEEKQLSIEDISSNNEDNLEQDENVGDIQGNANLYISLLKIKLDDLYRQCGIPDKDYEQMKNWLDKVAITIIEAKSFTELVSKFSTDLSKALGN